MGDRIVYTIKQSDGLSLNLYSHWGGYDRFMVAADALNHARPRWNDESYCARILVSRIIGQDWNEETGFGLWAGNGEGMIYAGDHQDIIIDMSDKTVTDESGTHDWDKFINYHIVRIDKIEHAVV
jgi:hypothetical protein